MLRKAISYYRERLCRIATFRIKETGKLQSSTLKHTLEGNKLLTENNHDIIMAKTCLVVCTGHSEIPKNVMSNIVISFVKKDQVECRKKWFLNKMILD